MERKVNKELNDATNEAIDIIPKVFEVPKNVKLKETKSPVLNDN